MKFSLGKCVLARLDMLKLEKRGSTRLSASAREPPQDQRPSHRMMVAVTST